MTTHDAPPSEVLPFTSTRVLNAPLDLVWKVWSEAEHIQHWWGPKGCKLEVPLFDFREGGFFHYAMVFPNGTRMWGRFLYREISAPHRLCWHNSFSNDTCGITWAPFGKPFPLEIRNEVTFNEKNGQTTVVLTGTPHGATDEERAVFNKMFPEMEQGFGGTFDQLTAYLKTIAEPDS
ncbi:MAG: SRPBCC domain-containing protein [Alphaproteobacteria bacterium]|nr:SRPBCC domain-containing protein [Alphaproteobacteria bacterium]